MLDRNTFAAELVNDECTVGGYTNKLEFLGSSTAATSLYICCVLMADVKRL